MVPNENKSDSYSCNGSQVDFPITFPVIRDTQGNAKYIKVTRIASGGTTYVLSVGSEYAVNGLLVTTVATYPSGDQILLERDMPFTQLLDLKRLGRIDLESLEELLDQFIMALQQVKSKAMTAPTFSIGDAPPANSLPLLAERASRTLGFDSDGDWMASTPAATAVSSFIATLVDDVDAAAARTTLGLGSMALRNVTVSTSDPTGGSDGDLWFKREA